MGRGPACRLPAACRLQSVRLPACVAIKAATSQAAPLFPPCAPSWLHARNIGELTHVSMSLSPRTHLLLFLISLSSRLGRSRYIEVRLQTSLGISFFQSQITSGCAGHVCRKVMLQMDYSLYSIWTRKEIRRTLFSADPSVSA